MNVTCTNGLYVLKFLHARFKAKSRTSSRPFHAHCEDADLSVMALAFQSNNDEEDTETFSLGVPGMSELVVTAALNSRIKFDRTDVEFSKREVIAMQPKLASRISLVVRWQTTTDSCANSPRCSKYPSTR